MTRLSLPEACTGPPGGSIKPLILALWQCRDPKCQGAWLQHLTRNGSPSLGSQQLRGRVGTHTYVHTLMQPVHTYAHSHTHTLTGHQAPRFAWL